MKTEKIINCASVTFNEKETQAWKKLRTEGKEENCENKEEPELKELAENRDQAKSTFTVTIPTVTTPLTRRNLVRDERPWDMERSPPEFCISNSSEEDDAKLTFEKAMKEKLLQSKKWKAAPDVGMISDIQIPETYQEYQMPSI